MLKKENIIVLLSGGMDSAVLLWLSKLCLKMYILYLTLMDKNTV